MGHDVRDMLKDTGRL